MSFIADSRSSTAVWASLNWAPSMTSAHSIKSVQPVGFKSEVLPEHFADELRARPVCRIVKFFCFCPPGNGLRPPAQEGALVMIKPPGQARIAGVLEIDDGVLVSIELHVQKQLAGAMGQPLVLELTIIVDRSQIKIAENGGGRESIETIIMKINFHYPHMISDLDFLPIYKR